MQNSLKVRLYFHPQISYR